MIAAVAEFGYNDATVARVTAAVGVSRRTFYLYFASKQECYLRTYDLIAAHIREAASAAAAGHSEWPARTRAVLGAMLDVLAANPDLVCFCLVAPRTAGSEIAKRHQLSIESLLGALASGLPATLVVAPPSQAAEESLVGGISALIVRKVNAGEGTGVGELLPTVMELALAPYLGREEARKITHAEMGATIP